MSLGVYACARSSAAPKLELQQRLFETVVDDYDDLGGQPLEELDCTAEKFKGRLFAHDEQHYARLETRFGTQTTSQTAWLRDREGTVEATVGGCAHYSYSFEFSNVGTRGDSRQVILDKAIAQLRALPLTENGALARDAILAPMAAKDFRLGQDDTCHFPETEGYSWSDCSMAAGDDGSFGVYLLYTIAL